MPCHPHTHVNWYMQDCYLLSIHLNFSFHKGGINRWSMVLLLSGLGWGVGAGVGWGYRSSSSKASLIILIQHIQHIQQGARKSKLFKEPRNRFQAWLAGTTTLFVVPARRLYRLAESIPQNRFLGSLNVYKYGRSTDPFAVDYIVHCTFIQEEDWNYSLHNLFSSELVRRDL